MYRETTFIQIIYDSDHNPQLLFTFSKQCDFKESVNPRL